VPLYQSGSTLVARGPITAIDLTFAGSIGSVPEHLLAALEAGA
jgi:hypothetical protein